MLSYSLGDYYGHIKKAVSIFGTRSDLVPVQALDPEPDTAHDPELDPDLVPVHDLDHDLDHDLAHNDVKDVKAIRDAFMVNKPLY